MNIRPFKKTDTDQIARLFHDTVRYINNRITPASRYKPGHLTIFTFGIGKRIVPKNIPLLLRTGIRLPVLPNWKKMAISTVFTATRITKIRELAGLSFKH